MTASARAGSRRPGPWREHFFKSRGRKLRERAVVEHHRGVNEAAQGRLTVFDCLQHLRDIVGIGHIGLKHNDLGTGGFERDQALLAASVDRPLRPTSVRWRAPCCTSHWAIARPKPPSPPVIKYVALAWSRTLESSGGGSLDRTACRSSDKTTLPMCRAWAMWRNAPRRSVSGKTR